MSRNFIKLSRLLPLFVCGVALADVPRLIHHQGKLRDATGGTVSGSVDLRYRLYDADTAGNQLFEEGHDGVAVTNGLFSVLIGSQSVGGVPDSALDAGEVWLGVTINNGAELSPRSRIGSGPHAVKARSAERLVKPDTFDAAVTVDAGGSVGIGTASPSASAALEIASTSKGLLPPRMTAGERDTIAAPADGLIIFNSTTMCVEFHFGGAWYTMGCATVVDYIDHSGSTHTDDECVLAGGTVVAVTGDSNGTEVCQFDQHNCPAGWTPTGWQAWAELSPTVAGCSTTFSLASPCTVINCYYTNGCGQCMHCGVVPAVPWGLNAAANSCAWGPCANACDGVNDCNTSQGTPPPGGPSMNTTRSQIGCY